MDEAYIIDDVLDEVSTFYGVTLKDILSRARTQRILTARHTAIYLAHRMSGVSLE